MSENAASKALMTKPFVPKQHDANGRGARSNIEPKLKQQPQIHLVPFDQITLSRARRYLVKNLIPRVGITVVWGPPKCFKSFWVFDMVMHVALGWKYRELRVQQGTVVYCAFEGQSGFQGRKEAFQQRYLVDHAGAVPFFLEPVTLDLVKDHVALIAAINRDLGELKPAVVVLDTLNRSLRGSESKDEDMGAYVQAADAVRAAFECAVIIVHHCGVDASRPRGHTALTGAADAQLSVKREGKDRVVVQVEWMKDGPEGLIIASSLDVVDVGINEDGDPITSCVVVPALTAAGATEDGPKLTKNQQTLFSLLHEAGSAGLTAEQWNSKARDIGIGTKRKADIYDLRAALVKKKLVHPSGDRWFMSA